MHYLNHLLFKRPTLLISLLCAMTLLSGCEPEPVVEFELLVENQEIEPDLRTPPGAAEPIPTYDIASSVRFTLRDISTGASGYTGRQWIVNGVREDNHPAVKKMYLLFNGPHIVELCLLDDAGETNCTAKMINVTGGVDRSSNDDTFVGNVVDDTTVPTAVADASPADANSNGSDGSDNERNQVVARADRTPIAVPRGATTPARVDRPERNSTRATVTDPVRIDNPARPATPPSNLLTSRTEARPSRTEAATTRPATSNPATTPTATRNRENRPTTGRPTTSPNRNPVTSSTPARTNASLSRSTPAPDPTPAPRPAPEEPTSPSVTSTAPPPRDPAPAPAPNPTTQPAERTQLTNRIPPVEEKPAPRSTPAATTKPTLTVSENPPPPPPSKPAAAVSAELSRAGTTGAQLRSFSTDCGSYAAGSATVTLTVREAIELRGFSVNTDGCGKVRITLTGDGRNESVTQKLAGGPRAISVSHLGWRLAPGKRYTLTLTPLGDGNICGTDAAPALASNGRCGGSDRPASQIALDYGGRQVLYDFRYFY